MDQETVSIVPETQRKTKESVFTNQALSLNKLIAIHCDELKKENLEAWSRVLEDVFVYCYNVVRTKVRSNDPKLIEDLSSEALLRIREKFGKYDAAKSSGVFTKWANAVIRNICHDYYRVQKRIIHLPLSSIPNLIDKSPDLFEKVALNEYLRSLLEELPPHDRDMWLDKHYYGKTSKEIAKASKYSQNNDGAVNRKLNAIKAKLNEIALIKGPAPQINYKWEGEK